MKNYEFAYNITDVIGALGLPVRKYNSSVIYVDCPECKVNPENGHDGTGKLEVVIANNYCHCCRCGFGGGMLALYSRVIGCTEKQAHKEMLEYVGKSENKERIEKNIKRIQQAVKVAEQTSHKAPDVILDKTYRAFLSQLKLFPKHYRELTSRKRSLLPQYVKGFGFKSVPTDWKDRGHVIKYLLTNGYQLEGVPGFYINKKGNWDFNAYNSGYFIPLINLKKQVIGMQIKIDDPKDGKSKYICFSSPNKKKGTKSGSPVHITVLNQNKTVYITEGALKADIAYSLCGRAFCSIQGVNAQKNLEPFFKALKKRGVNRIIDCFDADCEYNEQVEAARQSLQVLVEACGLNYSRMSWSMEYPGINKKLKGIDDYMIYVPKKEWNFTISQ